jgi:hypothetical protein
VRETLVPWLWAVVERRAGEENKIGDRENKIERKQQN